MVGATASTLMGVMNPLLGKLSTLLEEEYGKLKGLHSGIASLRDELRSMEAALEDLSQLEEPSQQVKEWMHQLRELSYDIEDCIDVFVQHLGQDDAHDGLISKIIGWIRTMKVCHHTAGQIGKLKEHAVEISDRRKRLKLDIVPSSSAYVPIDPRLSAFFEEAGRIIGIDVPRDELIEWVTSDTNKRRVISIVGSGGIGKTTLANQVYQKVRSRFSWTVFVSVSRSPNIIRILSDILSNIIKTNNTTSDDQKQLMQRIKEYLNRKSLEYHELVNMTREFLENKSYFVLIDDVWSKQAWKDIQCAFPSNNNASRIMMTTRIQDVAKSCSFPHESHVYSMKHLGVDDSKRLFLKRIFGHENACPLELKEVTSDILKKCGGLPLAIVNIASLLATKPATKQEWERVKNSIFCVLERDHEMEVVKRILFLSYYDLPDYLKVCLLDLSRYPEDFLIKCEHMIWRWIAEGFISGKQGQNLEEVGERYFNELINRNMVQLVQMDYSGKAINCRIHDIMLDLLICLSTEENFVTIVNSQTITSSTDKIRRLSLQGNCEENSVWLNTSDFSHVRSLSAFGDCKQIPMLSSLQILRVLDLEGCNHLNEDNVRIEDIGSLHQLRYLCIHSFTKVPRQIGKLQLLQTLDLTNSKVTELPASIVQLRQLVSLELGFQARLPDGISNMRALQYLRCFNCSKNSINVVLELGNIIKLKRLVIHWDHDITGEDEERYKKPLVSSLCKLGQSNLQILNITRLYLYCTVDFLIESWYPPPQHLRHFEMNGMAHFHRIPRRISSFSTLIYLDIRLEQLEEEDMQPLKDLPVLVNLYLEVRESNQETLIISHGGFQCLKDFSLLYAEDKKGGPGMIFEGGVMPKLQRLNIRYHAHITVPERGCGSDFSIHQLTSLKLFLVDIYCAGATAREVEVAEVAIRNHANLHPNHPSLEVRKFLKEHMATNEDNDATEQLEGTSTS
ncbi:disease resistance protein RGA5-like [Oryza sativa Japonica Group]|nr:disease resistance protein RGA5-like [Oryza sativa Japonica Group]XP_015650538.1 disease resistance protein RGA5-like [Oryza sativa Japonica Group]BAC99688.1 putative disease resistance protein [Oryza sativa Japonica Group]